MASTDYPLSVSSKFIDNAGTEHLVTVRGRNLDDFQGRLNEAGHIFPYAGFAQHTAPATQPDPVPSTPTPIKENPVAASADQASINANTRAVKARVDRKNAAPTCPQHQRKMSPSKFGNGDFYCTAKNGDGYCQHTLAA